jgi:hypothetical protein
VATVAPPPVAAARRDPTRRGWASAFGATAVLVGIAAAALIPNLIVEPMDGMTHYMAFVGPGNPGHPWTLLLGMGGMIVAYAGPLAALLSVYPARHRQRVIQGGVLALTLATCALAGYFARYALGAALFGGLELHGTVDWLSVILLILTPVPLLAASLLLLATGRLEDRWVWIGAVLLHLGTMIFGMAATSLLGGSEPHGHAEALALLTIRWG